MCLTIGSWHRQSQTLPICTRIFQYRVLLLATAVVFVPTASSSSISNPLPRALVFDLAGPLWMPPLGHLRGGGGAPFTLNENGNLKEIELYFIETHF